MLDYGTLRLVWWALLGVLLAGFAIMDGFDLGVAMLHPFVARTEGQRRVALNTIGPVWEGNQVWFVLGGGAIFAAWPLLYAASFSGFYLAMMLVLIGFILRPVALTFRSKRSSPTWRAFWDYAFFVSGLVPALVFGVAFGNLLRGLPFDFDQKLQVAFEGSLLGLLNPFALLCGLVSISMLTLQGACYLASKSEGEVAARSRLAGGGAAVVLILLFLVAGAIVAFGIDGYVLKSTPAMGGPSNPLLKEVVREPGAWLFNYVKAPASLLAPVVAILGAAVAAGALRWARPKLAMVASSLGVAGVIATAGFSLFPFFMPSSSHPGHSLTLWDASSSRSTLTLMLFVVVIFLPIVLGYTIWAYRVFRGVVSEATVLSGDDYHY
jgi:cytochrome d ubiquinol oxidase subunit II